MGRPPCMLTDFSRCHLTILLRAWSGGDPLPSGVCPGSAHQLISSLKEGERSVCGGENGVCSAPLISQVANG